MITDRTGLHSVLLPLLIVIIATITGSVFIFWVLLFLVCLFFSFALFCSVLFCFLTNDRQSRYSYYRGVPKKANQWFVAAQTLLSVTVLVENYCIASMALFSFFVFIFRFFLRCLPRQLKVKKRCNIPLITLSCRSLAVPTSTAVP